jgi:hypothetical protein
VIELKVAIVVLNNLITYFINGGFQFQAIYYGLAIDNLDGVKKRSFAKVIIDQCRYHTNFGQSKPM